MEFESWLERHASGLPKSMEIRPFDTIGSGVFTHTPIVDRIMEIPLSIVLTEDKVEQSAEGRAFDRTILAPVSPRGKFYCFLISQRNNKDSFFGPYLRSLPRQYNTPFYWTAEEVQLLAGTNLANILRDTTAALQSEFERYFPLLSQQCPQWFAASIQFQDYIWAHCTYTSRGFPAQVGRSSGSLGCLLPLVDMLNHRHLTPIEWDTSDTDIVIKHCGAQSICANQQVFNNYGAKSNGEFLLGYGFCVADNFDYDSVLVIVGISRQDPLYQQKMDVIKQQGLKNQCHLNARILSTELQQIMRIAVMDQLELRDMQQNQQVSLDYINVENELNMMESLERLIKHSLQKIHVLVVPPSGDSINSRNATLYREGQQNILQVYLSKLLPEYYTRVSQQHAEEFAPYLE